MNAKVRKAIDETFEELRAMSKEQFLKEFEKHKDGDIAKALIEFGEFEVYLKNLIDSKTGEPFVITLDSMDSVKNFIDAGISGREAGERFKKMFKE